MHHPHHHNEPIVLIGGGGHSLVVMETCLQLGLSIAGVYDDDPRCVATTQTLCNISDSPRSIPRLGDLSEVQQCDSGYRWIISLGNLQQRAALIEKLAPLQAKPVDAIVHPSAYVSPSATIECGSFISPGAIVHSCAHIGPHAIVNTRAVVEHECSIGTNVHIAPGSVLGGRVRVGYHTLIGLNSTILPNTVIGHNCIVGAGAVVIHDVSDRHQIVGVPGKASPRQP